VKVVLYAHSIVSDWNNGNAHFLRGILCELEQRGHRTLALEPADGWSRANLLADQGAAPLARFAASFPQLTVTTYDDGFDHEAALDGADLVLVHEWTPPELVARLGRLRRAGGRFTLLFHDTHHRAVSDPEAIRAFDLGGYDGVLAFGEALAAVYRRWGWGRRAFVWHEAADVTLFHPPTSEAERKGLVWIGNWGDGERTQEIESFLLAPARDAGLPLDIHGVRYPKPALRLLARYGARYHGWLPNARAPQVFASHLATVHVPRRFYVRALPGIPTIRVFEALACGIPLVCAPWSDAEGLFRPGQDYLIGRDRPDMTRQLMALKTDPALRASLVRSGRETILARHTCARRADELLTIARALQASELEVAG
jgi:spore maturation protein CgeB